jgi:ATP-dependent Clp protease ATP-binding subunit ClpA
VDFKNTILIMTSNLGSDMISTRAEAIASGGAAYEQVQRDVLELLKRSIRPEFLNRIDEILVFKPLERKDLGKIIDIQIARIAQRLAKQDISIEVDERAKEVVLRYGYDPVFGARPMKRALQHLLLDPLGEEILSGQIKPGETVLVKADGDKLKLKAVETAGKA